jgi:hypothetical protein
MIQIAACLDLDEQSINSSNGAGDDNGQRERRQCSGDGGRTNGAHTSPSPYCGTGGGPNPAYAGHSGETTPVAAAANQCPKA